MQNLKLPEYFNLRFIENEMIKYPNEDLVCSRKTTSSSYASYSKVYFKRSLFHPVEETIEHDERVYDTYKKRMQGYFDFCNKYCIPYRLFETLDSEQILGKTTIQNYSEYIEITLTIDKCNELLQLLRRQLEETMNTLKTADAKLLHEGKEIADKIEHLKIVSDIADYLLVHYPSLYPSPLSPLVDGKKEDEVRIIINSEEIYIPKSSPDENDHTIAKFSNYNLEPLTSNNDMCGLFVAALRKYKAMILPGGDLSESEQEHVQRMRQGKEFEAEAVYGYRLEKCCNNTCGFFAITIISKKRISGGKWY